MPRPFHAVVLALGVVALTACQTGERPTFDTSVLADSGIDADIISLFQADPLVAETATYEVRQLSQDITTTAILTRDNTRIALDVRDIQFRASGGNRETCNRVSTACRPGYEEQRLSDLQISTGFWSGAVVELLRSPAYAARIGPVTIEDDTVAGQLVTCVKIPGPNRTDRFCALASGSLALMETAAVTITLTSYRSSFDQTIWDEIPPS